MPTDKPTDEDLKYWENVLHDHRLGMGRGRRNWLVYGHDYLDGDDANEAPEESE